MKRATISAVLIASSAVVLGACGSSSSPTAGAGSSPAKAAVVKHAAAINPASASLVIQHVTQGCHSWLVNGSGALTPKATLKLRPGATLTVTDNDVMPHTLIATGGPAAAIAGAAMSHMSAKSTVKLPVAGVYTFATKAGEDYSKGITTTGADHNLTLKVVVS
jgi:plastocyanin